LAAIRTIELQLFQFPHHLQSVCHADDESAGQKNGTHLGISQGCYVTEPPTPCPEGSLFCGLYVVMPIGVHHVTVAHCVPQFIQTGAALTAPLSFWKSCKDDALHISEGCNYYLPVDSTSLIHYGHGDIVCFFASMNIWIQVQK